MATCDDPKCPGWNVTPKGQVARCGVCKQYSSDEAVVCHIQDLWEEERHLRTPSSGSRYQDALNRATAGNAEGKLLADYLRNLNRTSTEMLTLTLEELQDWVSDIKESLKEDIRG